MSRDPSGGPLRQTRLRVPAHPSAVPAVRRFVRNSLTGWEHTGRVDDAEPAAAAPHARARHTGRPVPQNPAAGGLDVVTVEITLPDEAAQEVRELHEAVLAADAL